jgi:hypothetical protein
MSVLGAALRKAAAKAPPATASCISVPAPMGSINTISSGAAMPAEDCIQRWNLIPAEYGLRTRMGSREWVTGLGEEVRSILPFMAGVPASNRIFAATQTGIWDVTDSGFDAKLTGVSATPLLGGTVPAGTYYIVAAAVLNDSEGICSDEVTVVCTAPSGRIDVAFTPITGATAYRMYVGTNPGAQTGYTNWVAGSPGEIVSLATLTPGTPRREAEVRPVTFGVQDATSGHGSSCVMVTSAGHFLVYCDESNGAYVYTESTGTWAQAAITGVDPGDLVHVCAWKNRLWFTERGTGKGWYLAVNAVGGAATSHNFGARFQAGGELRALASWTYDGGAGIDDSLVAVSSGGDVVVYQGTDPSSASAFGLRGVWSAGAVPAGRRILSAFGGDLVVMTTAGLVPMSKLVLGSVQGDASQYATAKIANLWNKLMLNRSSALGWQMVLHPQDATLIVIAPVAAGQDSEQLAMSLHTKGWSRYRDLHMGNCAATYEGTVYFGTADGRVCVMDGYVDGVTLADPSSYEAINWALLTSFQNLGTAKKKRLHWVKTTFLSDSAPPNYSIEARYDWNTSEVANAPSSPSAGGSTWDSAIWDSATWATDYGPTNTLRGLVGSGSRVALAVKGASTGRTVLEEFEVSYSVDGVL